MAETSSPMRTIRVNLLDNYRPRAAHVLTDVQRGDMAAEAEWQTFHKIVFAVAAAMYQARNEKLQGFNRRLWLNRTTHDYLYNSDPEIVAARVAAKLPGATDPFTAAPQWSQQRWLDRLAALYKSWTTTVVKPRVGGGTSTSSIFADDTKRKLYQQMYRSVIDAQAAFKTECTEAYGSLAAQARSSGVQTPDGKLLSIAGNAPHWIAAYDALDFGDPEVLEKTLGQVKRNQQAAAGASYAAASPTAQAWAGAVRTAAAGARAEWDAIRPDRPERTTPSQQASDTDTGVPWGWIVVGLIALAAAGGAVYYFTR